MTMQRTSLRFAVSRRLAWLLASASLVHCAKPRTQLVIHVRTDIAQDAMNLSRVVIQAQSANTRTMTGRLEVTVGPGGQTSLPADLLTLTSRGGTNTVSITVEGQTSAGATIAQRTRQTNFIDDQTGWVVIDLAARCTAAATSACAARSMECGFDGCEPIAQPALPMPPSSTMDAGTDAAMDANIDGPDARDSGATDASDVTLVDRVEPIDAMGCGAGRADCDRNAANGCETDITTSASHCGACGNPCGAASLGTRDCVSGRCVLRCNAGQGDCDNDGRSCETTLSNSLDHCGACGRPCPSSSTTSTPSCSAGMCTTTACSGSTRNCDRVASNGCEANIQSDAANCGGCGVACAAGAMCVSGRCSDQIVARVGVGGSMEASSSCALRRQSATSAQVVCWGDRAPWSRAGSTNTPELGPPWMPMPAMFSSVVLALTPTTVAALVNDGSSPAIYTAGGSFAGLLGDGSGANRAELVRISASAFSLAPSLLAAGESNFCASDGRRIACWGRASDGVTGGTMPFPPVASTPQLITIDGAAGPSGTIDHLSVGPTFACAARTVTVSGQILCWGTTSTELFTNGRPTEARGTAMLVDINNSGDSRPRALAVGAGHACFASNSRIYCWGSNSAGQCGAAAGATIAPGSRVIVDLLAAPGGLAAGRAHTCVATTLNDVYCWGDNSRGQLGRPGASSSTPVRVLLADGAPLANVAQISAAQDHTCAVRSDGSTLCWGAGTSGQIGNGASSDQPSATPIAPIP